MLAPAENNFAMKFKAPEERAVLCVKYIEHVESGLSDECFPQTLRKYIEKFPEDFDTDRIEVAKRKRQPVLGEGRARRHDGPDQGLQLEVVDLQHAEPLQLAREEGRRGRQAGRGEGAGDAPPGARGRQGASCP